MLLQHLPAVYLVKGYMAEPPTNHEVRVHNGEKFLVLWVLKALPLLDYVEKQALRFGWEPTGEWLYDFVEQLGVYIHDDIDHELPDDEYAYRLIGWLIDNRPERAYVGACSSCDTALYAPRDLAVVECPDRVGAQ